MGLKTETATIDGIEFSTTQFDAMRALTLMGRLAQTVGPALGVISTASPETPLEELAPVMAKALSNLKPEELGSLALAILANTSAIVNGSNVDIMSTADFNKVFSGRLMVMFKAIIHALKVNYADFGFGSVPQSNAPTEAAKE